MTNVEKFVDEFIKRAEKFISTTEIWDDYPKDPSYQSLSTLLKDVVIPSLLILKKGEKK